MNLKDKIVKMTGKKCRTINLIGFSGAGKTFQYRKLHEAGMRVLYVSSEKKAATIADLEPDVWPIETFDWPLLPSERSAFKEGTFTSDLADLYKFIKYEDHGYDILFIDSGMRLSEDMASYFTKNTLTKDGKVDSQRGYGVFADKITEAFNHILSLADQSVTDNPVHIIITWGVTWVMDAEGRRKLGPIVDGKKFPPKLPYKFDDILYLFSDADGKRFMGTVPTDKYEAKVSSGVTDLPMVIKDPDLARYLEVLGGGGK